MYYMYINKKSVHQVGDKKVRLSSVGVSVRDNYFCSSPKTNFWSFSGCAAAKKKVGKTYLNV